MYCAICGTYNTLYIFLQVYLNKMLTKEQEECIGVALNGHSVMIVGQVSKKNHLLPS